MDYYNDHTAVTDSIKAEPMDQQDHPQDDYEQLADSIIIENTMLMKQEEYEDGPQNSLLDYVCHEDVPSSSNKVVRKEKETVKKCLYDPKCFCFVCGVYRGKKRKKLFPMTWVAFRKAYTEYFGIEIRDENKPWIPDSVCEDCLRTLDNWINGRSKGLPFGTPRIWSKPSENHLEDCYFCLCRILPSTRERYYPDLPTAKAPDSSKIAPGRARQQLIELSTDSDSVKAKSKPCEGEQNLLANCLRKPNEFCFICGEFIKGKKRYSINNKTVWERFIEYFETNQDPPRHPWEPKFSCCFCKIRLTSWSYQKGDGLPFGTPRTWSKPSHNVPMDCFFCMAHVNGRYLRNPYLDIPSSRAPEYGKIAPGRFKFRNPVKAENPPEPEVALRAPIPVNADLPMVLLQQLKTKRSEL